MLIRMDIKAIVVGGGPIASLVTLAPRKPSEGLATELPIRIGVVEATSISMGIAAHEIRPKTHDLMLSVLDRLEAELVGVAIVAVHGTTFFANLMLRDHNGQTFDVDSRPSDAIALAVRAGVPIYADDSVLATATMPDFDAVEKEEKTRELEEFHDFVESLSADDFNE
ncbi:bifunctional nuclease family protein [uncultured Olegusella sp.]|uniref:bifunctional nuclease family protein n=1 Tax=uncultured Olegusella sp. TaxID=1979846 RepID=UPI00345C9430